MYFCRARPFPKTPSPLSVRVEKVGGGHDWTAEAVEVFHHVLHSAAGEQKKQYYGDTVTHIHRWERGDDGGSSREPWKSLGKKAAHVPWYYPEVTTDRAVETQSLLQGERWGERAVCKFQTTAIALLSALPFPFYACKVVETREEELTFNGTLLICVL